MNSPDTLQCEYLVNPLGIEVARPRLNWALRSERRGDGQTAYQILASTSPKRLAADQGDLWDSDKVPSDLSTQIEYHGKPLASSQRCYWKVRVWDRAGNPSPWSAIASWTMGLLRVEEWGGPWIGARSGAPSNTRQPWRDGNREKTGPIDPADAPAVLLRRRVTLARQPVRATAHICGLGYHEWFINGRRVGDHRLDPAFTDYSRRVLYVTHDVSDLFRSGENVVGVLLGNGFYCLQTPDLFQLEKAPWRTPPRLRLQIALEYADGTTSTIVSDTHWKTSTGAIRYNCIRGGETIDARMDPGPWLETGYDDTTWQPALEVSAPVGKLTAQTLPPIRISERFQPSSITEPAPGVYLVDFGGNLAGWVRLKTTGETGRRITLDYGEVLNPDGTLNVSANSSHTYGRYQHQECILSGAGAEEFEPRFTYHAFRYVEIRGLARPPTPADLTAFRLHTQVPRAGGFECSDPQLTRLHDAARRTLEDCAWSGVSAEPVREKVIWLCDMSIEYESYASLFDCAATLRKQIHDIIDGQEPSGHFGPVIPIGGWADEAPGDWPEDTHDYRVQVGDQIIKIHSCDGVWNGVILALAVERLALEYGDRRILEQAYDACRRYTNFLTATAKENILAWGLWDWTWRPGTPETKSDFISTASYYRQVRLMVRLATRLGLDQESAGYSALAESIKQSFNRRFYDTAGGFYHPGTQSAQSVPLTYNLVPQEERERVKQYLLKTVHAAGNRLESGFVGTMPTLCELEDMGRGDLSFAIVADGWYPMLHEGVRDTLAESPYGVGCGHHQFGGVVAGWIYLYHAGIRPDLSGGGYKQAVIRPSYSEKLTWVKAHHDSVHGRIVCNWQRQDAEIILDLTIPANTSAMVYTPAHTVAQITEGGRAIGETEGVTFLRMEEGRVILHVESGAYRLSVGSGARAIRQT
jgi:alpha-L-rhamnosidase